MSTNAEPSSQRKRGLRAAVLVTIGVAAAYLVQVMNGTAALATVLLLCGATAVGMTYDRAKERRREAAAESA